MKYLFLLPLFPLTALAHPLEDCPFIPATPERVESLLDCETVVTEVQQRLKIDFIYNKSLSYVNRFTDCQYVRDVCAPEPPPPPVVDTPEVTGGSVRVSWDRPTTREDGSELKPEDIAGYVVQVYWNGELYKEVPTTELYVVIPTEGATGGTVSFVVITEDTGNLVSKASKEAGVEL